MRERQKERTNRPLTVLWAFTTRHQAIGLEWSNLVILLRVGMEGKGLSRPEPSCVSARDRKAQWRLDFVAVENSMGFHAPQESARILTEAIDFARQGQALAAGLTS